jgi:AraC-like DNA-binding protein
MAHPSTPSPVVASPPLDKPASTEQPTYSLRLVQPFLALLAARPEIPVVLLDDLKKRDPDDRIPIAAVHELLRGAIELTGDRLLGLKAGSSMNVGDTGALDYAVNSAATFREALEVTTRYTRLINDALDLRFEVAGARALVILDTKALLPPPAEDFMMASFYRNRICRYLHTPINVEVNFVHGAPPDKSEYERTFAPATLRFGMPFSGFALDAPVLDAPLPTADPKLHSVIRKHAERILSEMPASRNLTEKVRHLVTNELAHGQPTAAHIARKLHMSGRTLARRLEGEGTTFTEVLHDLRRRLAQQYVGSRDIALSEVAFLLGFSHTAAFHRAFKRWTKQTPLEYRRAHSR